ncbi:hypothetical protein GGS21DRAFT_547534 [Xylaria nigripes]|nr:hypothetical protein GGS21DRAFT_547534 [Xylaria nigripes]
MSRRTESQLRLETLGPLSAFYSGVANTSHDFESTDADDQSHWETSTNSSEASTAAVVYDKAPPPGVPVKKRTAGESVEPRPPSGWTSTSDLSEGYVTSMDSESQYNSSYTESSSLQAFDTSKLRAAKSLGRAQRAATVAAEGPQGALGEQMVIPPKVPEPSADLRSNLNAPNRPQQGAHNSERRPAVAYEVPPKVGRQHSVDQTQVRHHHPITYHLGHAVPSRAGNNRGDDPNSRHRTSKDLPPSIPSYTQKTAIGCPISTYTPYRPPATRPGQGPSKHGKRSASFCETATPSALSGGRMRADVAISKNHSVTNLPHSAVPCQPLPTSLAQNSQPGVSSGIKRQKAYYQLPQVEVRPKEADLAKPLPTIPIPPPIPIPVPVPTQPPSLHRSRARRASTSSARTSSPGPGYGAWESDHPRQKQASFFDRAQELLGRSINEHLVKAGQRPPPSFKVNSVVKTPAEGRCCDDAGGAYRDAATQTPLRSEIWDLSSAREVEFKVGVAVRASSLAQRRQKRHTVSKELHVNPCLPMPVELEAQVPTSASLASETSAEASDDPLFLGNGNGGMRSPASYSFFSSEYAQRRTAALMRQRQRHRNTVTTPSWRYMPLTMSSASLYVGDADQGETRRKLRV